MLLSQPLSGNDGRSDRPGVRVTAHRARPRWYAYRARVMRLCFN